MGRLSGLQAIASQRCSQETTCVRACVWVCEGSRVAESGRAYDCVRVPRVKRRAKHGFLHPIASDVSAAEQDIAVYHHVHRKLDCTVGCMHQRRQWVAVTAAGVRAGG